MTTKRYEATKFVDKPQDRTMSLVKHLMICFSYNRYSGRPSVSPITAKRLLGHSGYLGFPDELVDELRMLATVRDHNFNFPAQSLRVPSDFRDGAPIVFKGDGGRAATWVLTDDYEVSPSKGTVTVGANTARTIIFDMRYPGLLPLAQAQAIEAGNGGQGIKGTPIAISVAQTVLSRYVESPRILSPAANLPIHQTTRHLHFLSTHSGRAVQEYRPYPNF